MSEFRTAYGPKLKIVEINQEKSLTKQSMKKETDVNFIVAKYQKTGMMQHREQHEGQYGEFFAIDYHEALNAVIAAQTMFSTLPSSMRNRFNNDPGEFIAFVENPDNLEEMNELGLTKPLPGEPRKDSNPAPSSPNPQGDAGSPTPTTLESQAPN